MNPFLAHAEQQETSSQQRNDAAAGATTASQNMNTNNAAEISRPAITATTYTPAPAAGTPIAGPVPSQQESRANNFAVGSPFFSSQLYTGGPSVEHYENDELHGVGIRVFIVWTGVGVPRREIFQVWQRGGVFSVRPRDGVLASGTVYNQQIRRGESVNLYHVYGGALHFTSGV